MTKKKEKFVPIDKQQKRKRREYNKQKRQDWGGLNPATRREDKNAYKRKKQKEKEESYDY